MLANTRRIMSCCLSASLVALAIGAWPGPVEAARQFDRLCSVVKLEIAQELAMERTGFLAILEITNNEPDATLTDFSAALTFRTAADDLADPEDAAHLFFVQPPVIEGVAGIDGSGFIAPGQTAVISWFLMPAVTAGGEDPHGVLYEIGVRLGGAIYGTPLAPEDMPVFPDAITVLPDPRLEIVYFQPHHVLGDNPLTRDVVEAPVPFTLGVLVKNVGFGAARQVSILSEQPRVVESEQGLLMVPQLLGTQVNDAPLDDTSLTVNVGDIPPAQCRKASWEMITTLSGVFTELQASYEHSPELGGRATSTIQSVEAHVLIHEVKNDQPGRDDQLDFLAETTGEHALIPDTLYETDCNTLPVNMLQNVSIEPTGPLTARVLAQADFENWVFIRVDDPAQARYDIARLERSDGKVLDPHNYWTHVHYREEDNQALPYLNILDFASLGDYEYQVTYDAPPDDPDAPVTTLRFQGAADESAGVTYIRPDTRLFFTVEDDNPVTTEYSLDGGPFQPAFPFSMEASGAHRVEYFSVDASGNIEAVQSADLFVSSDPPEIVRLELDGDAVFLAGDSVSVRPDEVTLTFESDTSANALTASVDIFRGLYAWPTLTGVPSSPTTATTAHITVAGPYVDQYRYRLSDAAWSDERAVAEPIELADLDTLPGGSVALSVQGRSGDGDYDTQAVTVTWTVDPAAASLQSTVPTTPTRSTDATLTVSRVDRYQYRWQGGAWQPSTDVVEPITLAALEEGTQIIELIGQQADAPWQLEASATQVQWMVDRGYGLALPGAQQVRHAEIDPGESYVWDGLDDNGDPVLAGWYSIRLTVTDSLNRTTGEVVRVRVHPLISDDHTAAAPEGLGPQKYAQAMGRWMVWQDLRAGNWDIYGRNLSTLDPPVVIADGPMHQERPRTDGRWVVWEDRQPDGTWDIWGRALDAEDLPAAITATAGLDERSPVIEWPYVIYRARSVDDPAAPWQLFVHNLIDAATAPIDATEHDQLAPAIHGDAVVWQDFRNVGDGEIYLKDLLTQEIERITNSPEGQYDPVISDGWVIWAEHIDGNLDLRGYDRRRRATVTLTQTVTDESRPTLNGAWLLYADDEVPQGGINNLRLMNLDNLASIQLTNTASAKERPSLASGRLVWTERTDGQSRAQVAPMPHLQPVYHNLNAVAVTEGMANRLGTAFGLLSRWQEEAGVVAITRYTALLPQPVVERAEWAGDHPAGVDFALVPGEALWIEFDAQQVLDLAGDTCATPALQAGTNVLSFACFPDRYTAFQLIRTLGLDRVAALRVLDGRTGRWVTTTVSVDGSALMGEDFPISRIAVVMLEMKVEVDAWAL